MYKLLIALSVILALNCNAQQSLLGPELGVNLINISNTDLGRDYQLGWYGGIAYEYEFSDLFSLRSGVFFSQGKQASSSLDTSALDFFGGLIPDSLLQIPGIDLNTYTTTTSIQTQHYIQIPIMATLTWNNINVFGGIYGGIMVGAKKKSRIIEESPFMATLDIGSMDPTGFLSSFLPQAYAESYEADTETENLVGFDYGLKGGIGYEMEAFSVQATYNFGIPDYRIDSGGEEKINHQFFQASIRYMIPLSKFTGASSIK